MENKPVLPREVYDCMTSLWNAVYTDKELGKVYTELSNITSAPVTIEMVTRKLDVSIRLPLIEVYNLLHKYVSD